MPRLYKPNIPQDLDEIIDKLEAMRYHAPTFEDPSFDELYPGRDFSIQFFELNEGLAGARKELGESIFNQAVDLLGRMRSHFEAGSKGVSDETQNGLLLLRELQVLLKGAAKL
jgi:hypothetical protein